MKEEILRLAKENVQKRMDEAAKAKKEAQAAANEDTKSSAGDKFETSRAMAHQDFNLYSRQWHEAKLDWDTLATISPDRSFKLASTGALVKTSIGLFYLGTSVGLLEIDGEKIMVASIVSPMGEAMAGKRAGDDFEFRGRKIKISEVS